MSRKSMLTIGIATVWLVVVGGLAISAQDKYTVKVPGGLAFSEFRGYESWEAISLSRNDRVVAVIVGNPVMIDAYRAGIPANGKPIGCVVLVTRNAVGQTQHVVASYRPLSSLLLFSRVLRDKFAGTPIAEHFAASEFSQSE